LYTLVTTAHPVMNNIIWLSSSWKWNYLRISKVIQHWHWFEEVVQQSFVKCRDSLKFGFFTPDINLSKLGLFACLLACKRSCWTYLCACQSDCQSTLLFVFSSLDWITTNGNFISRLNLFDYLTVCLLSNNMLIICDHLVKK
jgi:hypothetical protein